MKKILIPLTIMAMAIGGEDVAKADDITIGIIGDQTGTTNLDTAYQILQHGVDVLKQRNLDLVLHVGDLVESTESEADIRNRFAQATGILNTLSVPWYMTPGDHDVNPPTYAQNSSDRSRETLFKALYGALNPAAANTLYYSFDAENYHFVVLNALEHLDTDPRWGNVFYSGLTDTQYDWLASDLANNTPGTDGTIILLHQPLWYNWTGWQRVHALLAQYNVKAVIAGHFHYNQSELALDGVQYWVVGATGGTTKQGSANAGDLQHVTVLSITDSGVSFEMVPLAPYAQTEWTSRPVMDIVEALDLNLGDIYSFATDSPVFLSGSELVSSCSSGDPAALVLNGIGNAAAVPVSVAINVTSSAAVTIGNPTFGDGFCRGDVNPYNCLLAASAGVAMSNNSTVQMSSYPPPPPLWTATVSAATPPPVGATISINVIQSFDQDGQTYSVNKTGTTTVQSCPANAGQRRRQFSPLKRSY